MSRDGQPFRLVRHTLRVRSLTVARTQEITPRMRRITLAGPALADFVSLAPEDHVKLCFPRPGEREPVLPTFGPLGVPLPTLGRKPIARDYTPRRCDAQAGELDIDFFLHGRGVASTWAEQARPGDVLGVVGPRGSALLTRTFDWHLFVGDETALPEFARRIEDLPEAVHATLVAVVEGSAEQQAFARPLDVHWIHRADPEREATTEVLAVLAGMELPAGEGMVWLAGEATEVRAVYRHLVRVRGVAKDRIHASGHWKRGVVAHDHHQAITLEDG